MKKILICVLALLPLFLSGCVLTEKEKPFWLKNVSGEKLESGSGISSITVASGTPRVEEGILYVDIYIKNEKAKDITYLEIKNLKGVIDEEVVFTIDEIIYEGTIEGNKVITLSESASLFIENADFTKAITITMSRVSLR